MARLFDGTDDGLQATVDLSGVNKFSLAFWLYWDSFADNDDLGFEFSANYNVVETGFLVNPNSSSASSGFEFGHFDNNYTTVRFDRPSGAAWHHYLLNWDKSTNPDTLAAWVDGVSQSTTAVLGPGDGNDNFGNHALNFMCRNQASLFGAGRMAEVAIWGGVLLGTPEAAALATGAAPPLVRPGLTAYWPLAGRASPEQELVGRAEATVNGAAYTDHPKVVYPSRPRLVYVPAAAPAGDAVPQVWAQYRRRHAG